MTQRETMLTDDELSALFSEAQTEAMMPSDALMMRVLMDAETEQTAQGAGIPAWSQPAQTSSWWQRALELIGGWGNASGLATATVAGLAIGFGAPQTVAAFTSTQAQTEAALQVNEIDSYALDELASSFYDLVAEG